MHLYGANSAEAVLGETVVTLRQETRYPWDGDIRLGISPAAPKRFALRLRVPGWCREAKFSVNGTFVPAEIHKGYATIEREWRAGDEVRIGFAMPVERLYANPEVSEDAGRVALKRGPVVYCLEEVDNGFAPQRLRLAPGAPIETAYDPGLLGGAVTLSGSAMKAGDADWGGALYRTLPPTLEPVTFKAIPYHLWANRTAGSMLVWLAEA